MDALEAVEKLAKLNERIDALDSAYNYLWDEFELRTTALLISEIREELKEERGILEEKLRAVQL